VLEWPELTEQLLSPPQWNDHNQLHTKDIQDSEKDSWSQKCQFYSSVFLNPIRIDIGSNMQQIPQMLFCVAVRIVNIMDSQLMVTDSRKLIWMHL
jgi:hypothetical protein